MSTGQNEEWDSSIVYGVSVNDELIFLYKRDAEVLVEIYRAYHERITFGLFFYRYPDGFNLIMENLGDYFDLNMPGPSRYGNNAGEYFEALFDAGFEHIADGGYFLDDPVEPDFEPDARAIYENDFAVGERMPLQNEIFGDVIADLEGLIDFIGNQEDMNWVPYEIIEKYDDGSTRYGGMVAFFSPELENEIVTAFKDLGYVSIRDDELVNAACGYQAGEYPGETQNDWKREKVPPIIHIPHSSTHIPAHIRRAILLDERELESELLKMTDHYVDELIKDKERGIPLIKYPFSRLVADPERFRDESAEIMASVGMAAVYRSTSDGAALRSISEEQKEKILRDYYDPHHKKIEEETRTILNGFGHCLIIDLHSFPSTPLPYELNRETPRPDICIGTDEYHTPQKLINFTEDFFHKLKWVTKRNMPFSGAFVPSKYYHKDQRVLSIMIEINRGIYMNEQNGEKLDNFSEIGRIMKDFAIVAADFISSYDIQS